MWAGDDVGDDFGFGGIGDGGLEYADDGRGAGAEANGLADDAGSLLNAVFQKRYVRTAAPSAFGPSSRMSSRRPSAG